MLEAPSFLFVFLLGVSHAVHIGDIVVIYTIDKNLNFIQTSKLFLFTLLTHIINLFLIYLIVKFLISISPTSVEHTITRIAGAIVMLLGIFFLYKRITERKKACAHHKIEEEVTHSSLMGIGILGGFIPCGEVVALGILSISTQIFLHNIVGFLTGLVLTLFILMTLGASASHSLHALRHNLSIRIVAPSLLILVGAYKIFFA